MLVLEKFKGKQKKKKVEREVERNKWRKIKNKFKINKLFLNVSSN